MRESLWIATLPYCISDDKNPEDMTKDAPDGHSADAVRYVLTAANQGQHSRRGHFTTEGRRMNLLERQVEHAVITKLLQTWVTKTARKR